MRDLNHFSVTIRRVGTGIDAEPRLTMHAHTLVLSQDGDLRIEGHYETRSFSPGAWDGFEVRRLSTVAPLPGAAD